MRAKKRTAKASAALYMVLGLLLYPLVFTAPMAAIVPEPGEAPPTEPSIPVIAPVEQAPQAPPPDPFTYIPEKGMTPEETLEAYLERQYYAYSSLTYVDISAMVDTSLSRMRNTLTWLELLIQRRRLLYESGLCYVDTRILPYKIVYLDEADIEDGRVSFWGENNIFHENEVMLHFVVKGAPGEAYPPMLAVNSQQSVRMRLIDGVWKISFHYYPGSVRKFSWLVPLDIPADEDALETLKSEFAVLAQPEAPSSPAYVSLYDGSLAAVYARLYAEEPNPDFYHIGDWMGNCANFTSQCIWYGFGGGSSDPYSGAGMTSRWFAGGGGGSPAWENVDNFWAYAVSSPDFFALELPGTGLLMPGDLIQTRARDMSDDRGFSHSLVVVDADTMLLAQNSPGNFVYYSDLVNIETRFLRPLGVIG